MRFAGESARSGVMMSFSRRIGALPSIGKRAPLIVIGDGGFADQDAFARRQFDLEGQVGPPRSMGACFPVVVNNP
jgi:hypothetical protein